MLSFYVEGLRAPTLIRRDLLCYKNEHVVNLLVTQGNFHNNYNYLSKHESAVFTNSVIRVDSWGALWASGLLQYIT
uniref:Ovule protein n=1 Tax=Strongyloides venezuelensis TaxID=75913 RepID=A0A0K0F4E2_STRVS